jgi:O-antigen/teichoic acid export membrane protein
VAERPRGNLVSLGAVQIFRLLAGLAVNVLVMRWLGVEGYGVYGYVLTLVGLCSFGASLGMERLLQREIAREPERAGRLVGTGLAAVSVLSLGATAVILGAAWLLDGRPMVMAASGLGALAMSLQALATIPVAWFHGRREMRLSVPGSFLGRAMLVLGTLSFLVGLQWGVTGVFVAQVLDAAATLVVALVICLRRLGPSALGTSLAELRELVRRSLPFGMNLLFGSVYLSADVLLLGELKDDLEVGVYRGAVMLISLFPIVANTLTNGVYPRMAGHLGQPRVAGAELGFVSRILLAVSVPAAVGGMLTAEPLMVFIGGPEWSVSARCFVVLAPMLPLRFLNNGLGMTLSALNQQQDRTRGVFLAALLNLGLNLAVIPTYGAVGAAATTLATEVGLAAWMHWRVRPLVQGLGLAGSLARVALPAAAMALVVWWMPAWHVLLTIGVGALVYGLLALATGALRRDDLVRLRRV